MKVRIARKMDGSRRHSAHQRAMATRRLIRFWLTLRRAINARSDA